MRAPRVKKTHSQTPGTTRLEFSGETTPDLGYPMGGIIELRTAEIDGETRLIVSIWNTDPHVIVSPGTRVNLHRAGEKWPAIEDAPKG